MKRAFLPGLMTLGLLVFSCNTAWAITSPRGQCHLADAAMKNQQTAAGDAVSVADQVITHPDKPSQTSCLSGIIKAGGDVQLTIPSIGDVFNNAVDRACNALENSWDKATSVLSKRAELPYGLGSIGVGDNGYNTSGSTGGGLGTIDNGIDAGRDAANSIDDQINDATDSVENGVQGSVGSGSQNSNGGGTNVPNIFH